ncbi:MAG: [acyl-carrier-protein] S-malonyltransferase [Gammaproteobacteria bacterium]|nr:MAG: [acyl-carrier-protein] S-malonyltransferase [Gammaproteobacteria bacterium]
MDSLAFVFPGQGSQSLGMLKELNDNQQIIRSTLTDASEALEYDVSKLLFEGPLEELNRTDQTQPALLASSVAIFRLWQQQSSQMPKMMAGHSLGEYSALVCAGVLDFSDALRLVRQRGRYMMQAVPEGTGSMAAIIGLDNELVEKACGEAAAGQVVSPVNYNSPGQLVIAGHKEAVNRAIVLCKEAGAKRALPIAVNFPFHCTLMLPAAEKLKQALGQITLSKPSITVINNVNVSIETEAKQITNALVKQLYSPVRWTETIQFMQSEGITTIIECGTGKVLAGLCKRIDKSITALVTADQAAFNKSLEALK